MNKTIELLGEASALEKKACSEFISNFTQAGIVELVNGGFTFEKAASTMRQVCENNSTLIGRQLNVAAFEKAAEYIQELESKVAELEKLAEHTDLETQKHDEKNPLSKLAGLGFSEEEISIMAQMPSDLVEKVASVNSKPWEMGNAVGMPREKTDPLLEFILN